MDEIRTGTPADGLLRIVDHERRIIVGAVGRPAALEAATVREMLVDSAFKLAYDAVRADWLNRGLDRSLVESLRTARSGLLNAAAVYFRPHHPPAYAEAIDAAATALNLAVQLVRDEDAIRPQQAAASTKRKPRPSKNDVLVAFAAENASQPWDTIAALWNAKNPGEQTSGDAVRKAVGRARKPDK